MKKTGRIFSILLCLLWSHIEAFVDYKLMSNENHMVMLLGDCHADALDSKNELEMNLFGKLLCSLQKGSNTKIKLIFELSPDEVESIKHNSSNKSAKIAKTFLCLTTFMLEYQSQLNNIDFLPYEPRSKESYVVATFFENIENIFLRSNFNMSDWDSLKVFVKSTMRPDLAYTISDFNQALKTNSAKLNEYKYSYEPTSAEFKIFDQELAKYKDNIKQIKSILKIETDSNVQLIHHLINILDKSKDLETLKSEFTKLLGLFYCKTDYLFADLSFLNEILKADREKTKVIFISGYSIQNN